MLWAYYRRDLPQAERRSPQFAPAALILRVRPQASHIVDDHSLDFGLGESSPLARIYDLNGFVLLLGASHGSNTSMHLAEYRANFPTRKYCAGGRSDLCIGITAMGNLRGSRTGQFRFRSYRRGLSEVGRGKSRAKGQGRSRGLPTHASARRRGLRGRLAGGE